MRERTKAEELQDKIKNAKIDPESGKYLLNGNYRPFLPKAVIKVEVKPQVEKDGIMVLWE